MMSLIRLILPPPPLFFWVLHVLASRLRKHKSSPEILQIIQSVTESSISSPEPSQMCVFTENKCNNVSQGQHWPVPGPEIFAVVALNKILLGNKEKYASERNTCGPDVFRRPFQRSVREQIWKHTWRHSTVFLLLSNRCFFRFAHTRRWMSALSASASSSFQLYLSSSRSFKTF